MYIYFCSLFALCTLCFAVLCLFQVPINETINEPDQVRPPPFTYIFFMNQFMQHGQ